MPKLERDYTIRLPLIGDHYKTTGLYKFGETYADVNPEFAYVVQRIPGLAHCSPQERRGIGLRALQRSGLSTLFFRDIWPIGNMLNCPEYKEHLYWFKQALEEGDRYLARSLEVNLDDILGPLDKQFYGL